MPDENVPIDGVIVPADSLTLPRARAFADTAALETLPYVRLIECRTRTIAGGKYTVDTVVIEVDVERPQKPVHDIRRTERLAIEFNSRDRFAPEALSLRTDFPWVPHVNLRPRNYLRSLCLYEESWSEVSPRWTPAAFIERIRYWLAATARGALHQDDQPLEPLLLHSGERIILPADTYTDLDTADAVRLEIGSASNLTTCSTLIARRVAKDAKPGSRLKFVGTTIQAKPQTHGLIRWTPTNLADLHSFLVSGEIDLLGVLRERLKNWADEPNILSASLVIIVALPVTRSEGGEAEKWESWAFATLKTIKEVGIEIGVWELVGEKVGTYLAPDETKVGESVPINVLSPSLAFSPAGAAAANRISPGTEKVVAVGAGALGSQLITSLYRTGFGDWTIVDEDDLMPHNLARHALDGFYIGWPKSIALAHYLDQIYPDRAEAIVADMLDQGENQEALSKAFAEADLILDCSASATVARTLATSVSSPARRVSVFLNPEGTDLVVLAEDKSRNLTLDLLEAQYYRAVNAGGELAGHLNSNSGKLRYGRSCRDISTTMSTQLVTLHAAIASQAVRTAIASDGASITIFRCNPETLAVTPVVVEPVRCVRQKFHGWTLFVDVRALETLAALRQGKLPNETGGVLMGLYDLGSETIYVVDTIPSPPDSAEWPTLYIRGSEGLLKSVEEAAKRTGGQLAYVGEWHSHPDGCATLPSSDDLQVFAWLTEHMATDSRPALMAIVGANGVSSWYMGEMLKAGGWEVTE